MALARTLMLLMSLFFAFEVLADEPLPPGSYHKSCSSKSISGTKLRATCNDGKGGSNISTIATEWCAINSIFNHRGLLKCFPTGPSTAHDDAIWPGSYLNSCKSPKMDGGDLKASCSMGKGNYRDTKLTMVACRWGADVANIKGGLVC